MTYYKNYLSAHDTALKSLEITNRGGDWMDQDVGFDRLCEVSAKIREGGFKQYLVGNGASAAFAEHMALDWTKNGGVPSHAFANSALLTAMGNDLGYQETFCAPLSWYANSGDLLITISSSGDSPNIIKTIETARAKGMDVVTFSGLRADNASRSLGDINLYIPAKTYGIVECAHQVLLHVWLDKFMGVAEWNCRNYQNMRQCGL
ncbi:SIS domain-containing protein [Coraliomargarita sp. SDUM461004]|uniref:SIS domain-containing protein n=1 Tax=Thalassobacterium sedimentorum TaxID=3041258 RepID=A0ABU1AEY9_9BACT|nr:SIS domain-containing protein [Coraliomargarita sp. SDUM461004]MDQ8193288.1 SIS domain-containing protein [Coraliomargarita sp. SDUM461004]